GVEVDVLVLVQVGDTRERGRIELHGLVRFVRAALGDERVTAHEVLDAIYTHQYGISRVDDVPVSRVEVPGHGEHVEMRPLDQCAQLVRGAAIRLDALGAPFHL